MFELREPMLTIEQLQDQLGHQIPNEANNFLLWLEGHKEECKKIKKLGISGNEVSCLEILKYFPNITHLIVFGGTGTKQGGIFLGPSLSFKGLKHCKHLEELFVANGTEDLDLPSLFSLKKISLYACKFFIDPDRPLHVSLSKTPIEKVLVGYFV